MPRNPWADWRDVEALLPVGLLVDEAGEANTTTGPVAKGHRSSRFSQVTWDAAA